VVEQAERPEASEAAADAVQDANRDFYADPDTLGFYTRGDDKLTAAERMLYRTYLREGCDLLDLGVGAGRTTVFLAPLARRYVGVDYAEPMVKACRERFPGLAFQHADAADLSDFDDASFDAVVFSFNGIDYISPAERRQRCLAECARVLRDDGVLIFSRHNPRAILRLPLDLFGGEHTSLARRAAAWAMVPVWSFRRSVRLLPQRTFWTGIGAVAEPPRGFNVPLMPLRRTVRDDPRPPLSTQAAIPRHVVHEVEQAGFRVEAVAGGLDPRRTRPLSTPWYHYVALRTARSAARGVLLP
jgi:SAM-dependent methyltransferase